MTEADVEADDGCSLVGWTIEADPRNGTLLVSSPIGAVRRVSAWEERDYCEPITEDWLRSVGFIEDDEDGIWAYSAVYIKNVDGFWYTQVGGLRGMWEHFQGTRGNVRRLMLVFGVQLEERA